MIHEGSTDIIHIFSTATAATSPPTAWILVPNLLACTTTAALESVSFQSGDVVYDRKQDKIGRIVDAASRDATGHDDELNESASAAFIGVPTSYGDDNAYRASVEEPPLSKRVKLAPPATTLFPVTFTKLTSDKECDASVVSMVNSRHLVPMFVKAVSFLPNPSSTVPILVTERTDVYRLLAASQLLHDRRRINKPNSTQDELQQQTNAVVLEIGSSTGCTSQIVWKQTAVQSWMGLDTSHDMIQAVQSKLNRRIASHPHHKERFTCHQMDPLQDPETAASLVRHHLGTTAADATPHRLIVLLDIGGNRDEGAVLRMVQWVCQSFAGTSSPFHLDQIIVKSEAVHQALQEQAATNRDAHDRWFDAWYQGRLRVAWQSNLPRHPLQAPKRFQPGTTTLICRYHNYYKHGCAKQERCPFDHDHCHVCLQLGHVASACSWIMSPTNDAATTLSSPETRSSPERE